MKKNIGTTDKVIRIILALGIGVLYYTNVITGTLGIVLLVVAGLLVVTSFISFCPTYSILGMSTCPVEPVKKDNI